VERGEAAAAQLGARFVQLDVSDDKSVEAALRVIGEDEGLLDVLLITPESVVLTSRVRTH